MGGEHGPIHSVVTPSYVRSVHLNGDGLFDFAGGWAEPPKAGKIQRPVYETMASLDGGATYTRIRSRCVEPFVNFADINQDGRYDLVTEDVELFSQGTREMALRLAADQSTPITVSVRLQREDERGFETDSIQGRFVAAKPLDDPEAILSGQSAWRVDITGDLDGDGWNDAVVRTAPDHLSVYQGGPSGWDKEPMGGLPIERNSSWSLYDLNADGCDDVALRQHDKGPHFPVYLSRPGDAPPNKGIVMGTKP